MEEQFQLSGLTETIGADHFYPMVQAAVQGFAHRADRDPKHRAV